MKDNNINQELQKERFFSNWSVKIFDESLVMGLVFSLFLWLFCDPKINSNALSCIFLGTTLFALIFQSVFCRKTFRKNTEYRENRYDGNIKDLMLTMYCGGLVLKNWGDNLYIFKTNNKFLPNEHFVVKDYIEYCSLLGQEDSLRRLESNLFLSRKNDPNTKNYHHGEAK